jgi:hypothetical protein
MVCGYTCRPTWTHYPDSKPTSLLFLLSAACLVEKQQISSIHGYGPFIVIVNKIHIDNLNNSNKIISSFHFNTTRFNCIYSANSLSRTSLWLMWRNQSKLDISLLVRRHQNVQINGENIFSSYFELRVLMMYVHWYSANLFFTILFSIFKQFHWSIHITVYILKWHVSKSD